MIKLILVDVDGTLVGPQGVPSSAWQAAAMLRERGVHLSVCTGRPGRGLALGYAQTLDPQGLHIFESGAAIVNAKGQVIEAHSLPLEAYTQLVHWSRDFGVALEAYTAEGGFFAEQVTAEVLAHQGLIGLVVEPLDLLQLNGTLVRAQFVTRDLGVWQGLRQQVARLGGVALHEATSPVMPGVVFASVTAQEVSKLSAARRLAELYSLQLSQVAMVGDGENDLEVLAGVGVGVAMGNAPQHVKQVAQFTVGHVENDGLAQALQMLGSLP